MIVMMNFLLIIAQCIINNNIALIQCLRRRRRKQQHFCRQCAALQILLPPDCVLSLNSSCLFDVAAFNTGSSSFAADDMSAIIFSSSAFLVLNKSVNNPGATDNRTPESSNFLINLACFIPIGHSMLHPCSGELLFNSFALLFVCTFSRDKFFVVVSACTMSALVVVVRRYRSPLYDFAAASVGNRLSQGEQNTSLADYRSIRGGRNNFPPATYLMCELHSHVVPCSASACFKVPQERSTRLSSSCGRLQLHCKTSLHLRRKSSTTVAHDCTLASAASIMQRSCEPYSIECTTI